MAKATKKSGSCTYLFERQIERLWRAGEPELMRCWLRAGYDWIADRAAVKHGFFCAFRWAWVDTWTPELEALIEREWMEHNPDGGEWDDVNLLVRHGWNEGRRHVTGYPQAQNGDEERYMYSEELGA